MANRSSRTDTSKLDQIIRETPGVIGDLLMGAAVEMLADIKLSFNTSPPGETYWHGDVRHVASQPGYPPNIDTAALTNSMHIEQESERRVIIADGVEHGIFMEQGTEHIAPRPFVAPVFEEWRQRKFNQYFVQQGIVKR